MSVVRRVAGGRPRFCPECGLIAASEGALCPECGATLLDQGYCDVCESYRPAPEGSACPKHEIALRDGPPPGPVALPAASAIVSWVTVATYPHPNAADAARIRLEAEGIPTFLEGERTVGNTLYQIALGGVKLQVPGPLAADARILLSQSWAPPPEADDDLDDAWEELGPESGASFLDVTLGLGLVPLAILLLVALYALARVTR